jgi:hypothetical protein
MPALPPQFRCRVQLYAQWDVQLAEHTRFFGAAAVTNALLARLCKFSPVLISSATLNFLNQAGAELQSLNSRLAAQIGNHQCVVTDLDEAIIRTEQAALQSELRKLATHNRGSYRRTILEVDRLLRGLRISRLLPAFAEVRTYATVLGAVHHCLGRPATFARECDRVCIGRQLIRHIRQNGVLR